MRCFLLLDHVPEHHLERLMCYWQPPHPPGRYQTWLDTWDDLFRCEGIVCEHTLRTTIGSMIYQGLAAFMIYVPEQVHAAKPLVAHNAGFDRALIIPRCKNIIWGGACAR